jgi:hypothetical protein
MDYLRFRGFIFGTNRRAERRQAAFTFSPRSGNDESHLP